MPVLDGDLLRPHGFRPMIKPQSPQDPSQSATVFKVVRLQAAENSHISMSYKKKHIVIEKRAE